MTYDIFNSKAPAMPKPSKGTEFVKLLLSQVSKDMQEPLFPMFFPVLGAHVSGSEMQYPDLILKELCGQMASLIADSCCNRGQLSNIVEAICRDSTTKRARLSCNFAHITCQSSPYSEPTSPIFRANLAHFLTFIVQGSTCFIRWRGSGCIRDQYRIEELK